ncbi:fimbrial protein, partial [Streptomyces griseofuscus]|uniref:fimbrial protein n=1 Tax=Streptomyces griseofuscus TaxID=146922 RepID=UPI0033DC1FEA
SGQLTGASSRALNTIWEPSAVQAASRGWCGPASVAVRFSGTAAAGDSQAFALDQDSVASGVAVKIANESYDGVYDYFVGPNVYWGRSFYPNSEGELTMKYAAQYVALDDHVTPGTANLTTQIDLYYN